MKKTSVEYRQSHPAQVTNEPPSGMLMVPGRCAAA